MTDQRIADEIVAVAADTPKIDAVGVLGAWTMLALEADEAGEVSMTWVELSERMGRGRTWIARMLRVLERAGALTREPVLEEGRKVGSLIRLTEVPLAR